MKRNVNSASFPLFVDVKGGRSLMDDPKYIPKELYSYNTNQPFDSCLVCEKDLLSSHEPYMIEKSIRTYVGSLIKDTVYDYAICFDCVLKQKESISSETHTNIISYIDQNIDNQSTLLSFDAEEGKHSCVVHGESIKRMTAYTMQAICVGPHLHQSSHPMVFGQQAMSEMEALISVSTRDDLDDFIDQHFGGPPEFREMLKSKNLII